MLSIILDITRLAIQITIQIGSNANSFREEIIEEEQDEKEDGHSSYAKVLDMEKDATWGDFSIYQR